MGIHSQLFVGEIDRAARAHGWICSVVSHGVVVTALVMSVEPIPVVQETFQWNVEIVSNGSSSSQPVHATIPSAEPPSIKETSETSRKENAFRRAATPPLGQITQKTLTERVLAVSEERSDQKVPQHVEVSTQPSEAGLPLSASVLSEQSTSDPQIAALPSDSRPLDSNEKQSQSGSTRESEAASSSLHDTTLNQGVMATNPPAMGESKRPDYGWLATAIRSRIEEIKRYSEQARSNGWEGRVVVATTVQADGRLRDIRVIESSGNGRLDEDAKQILRDASPMVLSQPLQAVQVIVKVPILFGLQ